MKNMFFQNNNEKKNFYLINFFLNQKFWILFLLFFWCGFKKKNADMAFLNAK